MSLLGCLISQLHAQFDLQGEQRFNRHLYKRPLIGFELLRSHFPLMIAQERHNGNNAWVHKTKWVTNPSGIDAYFSELGEYDYDTTSKQWMVNRADLYSFNYDFTNKKVIDALVTKRYQMSSSNSIMRLTYVFNSWHKPDTEFVERKTTGDFAPYSRFVFHYDTAGMILSQHYVYLQSGFWFKTYYNYDGNRQLISETTIAGNDASSPGDSSSRLMYSYDTLGRLTTFSTEVYDLIGRAGLWTTTNQIQYSYSGNTQVMSKHTRYTYDASDNYRLKKNDEFDYTYTAQGLPQTLVQTIFNNNEMMQDRSKIEIAYTNNEPDLAYEYLWVGGQYESAPVIRYQFSESNTGIETITKANFKMYPNPVSDKLYIETDETLDWIKVSDVYGRTFELKTDPQNHSVDLGALPSGIYFLQLQRMVTRIVKD